MLLSHVRSLEGQAWRRGKHLLQYGRRRFWRIKQSERIIEYLWRVGLVDTLALHGELSVVITIFQKVLQVGVVLILERCMYVFLLNHAKAVMSAAVRLSLVGPYQAQTILAAPQTRRLLKSVLDEVRDMSIDDAGQTWALLDVYQGRQEILYSRVFNGWYY